MPTCGSPRASWNRPRRPNLCCSFVTSAKHPDNASRRTRLRRDPAINQDQSDHQQKLLPHNGLADLWEGFEEAFCCSRTDSGLVAQWCRQMQVTISQGSLATIGKMGLGYGRAFDRQVEIAKPLRDGGAGT